MGGTLAPTNPPGGIAGTGISLIQNAKSVVTQKKQESSGVIQMMDNLKADLAAEIQELEFNEKDAQEEYEAMVTDAADKRAADTKSVEEKTAVKAGLEDEI